MADPVDPFLSEMPLVGEWRGRMAEAYDAQDAGDLEAAMAKCREIITALPRSFAPHYLLGSLLSQAMDYPAARKHLRLAHLLRPDDIPTLLNLGNTLIADDASSEALPFLRRAFSLAPKDSDIIRSLAYALSQIEDHEGARTLTQTALSDDPSNPKLAEAFARAVGETGERDAAVRFINAWPMPIPNTMLALKAALLVELDRYDEAGVAAVAALADGNSEIVPHNVLAKIAVQRKRPLAARDHYLAALKIDPHSVVAIRGLHSLIIHQCWWDQFGDMRKAILKGLEARKTFIYPFDHLLAFDEPEITREIAELSHRSRIVQKSSVAPSRNHEGKRLRIGFVSSDLRNHPGSTLMLDIFRRYDRSRLEVFAFSTGVDDGSVYRRTIASSVDHFIDMRKEGVFRSIEIVRDAAVDILIDRNGFTLEKRSYLFDRRLAPVQINYLGYPGTMGNPAYDYIIGDPVVTPVGSEAFLTENIVRMPDCYQPNAPRIVAETSVSRTEAGLPPEGFVFCAFNAIKKITQPYFETWMRLLKAVDGSVLWLVEGSPEANDVLKNAAMASGVDPSRIIFAPRVSIPEHIRRHEHADLFLDTAPYNAHTTGSDALFMGVPIVTCPGRSFQSRVGMSLLHAHGLPELVTSSLEEYEALALALARDPVRLAKLKARTLANKATHPLFDSERYVRHLEIAFQMMVDIHRSGSPPRSFDVPPLPRRNG